MTLAEKILRMVLSRMNRIYESDSELSIYLRARIQAAIGELQGNGIYIQDTPSDVILVCDYVCWQYGNRDDTNGSRSRMPEWLAKRVRERYLREERTDTDDT